mgnify:CR=1 FL=1
MDISFRPECQNLGPDTLKPSEAIAAAVRQGVAKERILMSSDGNGSAAPLSVVLARQSSADLWPLTSAAPYGVR